MQSDPRTSIIRHDTDLIVGYDSTSTPIGYAIANAGDHTPTTSVNSKLGDHRPNLQSRKSSTFSLQHDKSTGSKVLLPDAPALPKHDAEYHGPNHVSTSKASMSQYKDENSHGNTLIHHIHRPILPIIHLFLVATHLALASIVPYFLVKYLIQPLVLWIIVVVCLLLQVLYLLPGTILEIVALIRGRPGYVISTTEQFRY